MNLPVSAGREGALESVLAREQAATERRHWVRLTRRCNNRCLFCHDSVRQDGSLVPFEEVSRDILEGPRRGASRLVLSGGEPTLHPRFTEAVEAGARAGYRWLQAISNGRMFAYERFTARAVAAGLHEVTVSVHGHTPELHDHLVGARGAFAQSIRGIKNLVSAGRVVSIDVVVTRLNAPHLAAILKFFTAFGLRQFDLLYLVPFGRGFDDHRAELYLDLGEAREPIFDALRLSRDPGMHVWTNRWPAPLLEGAEHLIQDPHKLLDELFGMRKDFEGYLATGEGPECRGERCRFCFLDPFCRALSGDRARLSAGEFEVVEVDAAEVAGLGAKQLSTLERQGRAAYRVKARNAAEAEAILRCLPRGGEAALELDLERSSDLPPGLAARARRIVLRRLEDLPAAAAVGAELEVPLARGQEELATRAVEAAPGRAIWTLPGRSLLSEIVEREPSPQELWASVGAARVEGLACCLAPRSEPPRPTLLARSLGADGQMELFAWSEHYLRDRYRVKSFRCRSCAEEPACAGAHVNTVRAYGFGWMRPRPAP